jgi:hypothetical protein
MVSSNGLATRLSFISWWKTFQADGQSLGNWSEFQPPSSLHNPGSAQLNSGRTAFSPAFLLKQDHSRPFFDIWQWTKSSHKASEYPKHQTVPRFRWIIPKPSKVLVFIYLHSGLFQGRLFKRNPVYIEQNKYEGLRKFIIQGMFSSALL